jgi:hypothetical protein
MIYTSERKMKFNFTRLSLLALICMVSASIAMATPTCPTTTLANGTPPPAYENTDGSSNGYVCDFGGLEFSDFHTSLPGVSPTSVGVSPGFQPGTTPPNTNPGFLFTGPFGVNSNETQDINVAFTVTALTGLITDVHIQLDNSFVRGTGDINYTEVVCLTSTTNCALFVTNPSSGGLISDLILTTPQKSINISKDLILKGGANGTATMSAFSNYYSHSEVPEPRAVSALLGLGFFGIMAFMKRRQAVRS